MADRTEERTQFLTDVLVTAVEGGITYWARGDEYRYAGTPEARGVTITELVDGDEDDLELPYRITLDTVARGLNRIATGNVELPDRVRLPIQACNFQNTCAPDEGVDIDAELADVIVQVGAMGDVVFG